MHFSKLSMGLKELKFCKVDSNIWVTVSCSFRIFFMLRRAIGLFPLTNSWGGEEKTLRPLMTVFLTTNDGEYV